MERSGKTSFIGSMYFLSKYRRFENENRTL